MTNEHVVGADGDGEREFRVPTRLEQFHARAGRVLLSGLCVFLVAFAALGVSDRKADASSREPRMYEVKAGDTLSAIALRNMVSVRSMIVFNKLPKNGSIRVGTKLRIPRAVNRILPGALPTRLAANPSRLALRTYTSKWAKKNAIPVDLLEATLWLESGFNQVRVSSTGAVGVGQLMPQTSSYIATSLIGQDLDPRNVEDNIRMSARYLWFLLKSHDGDSTRALQSYYQGMGSIKRHGLYKDTIDYAKSVQALRRQFR